MQFVLLVSGLLLLVVGAELLVKGASRLARTFGVSPLITGLTVVAYGTSTPELVVSVSSELTGQGDIALGNVVGSNTFNLLFILGASAIIAPLVVSRELVRVHLPFMLAAAVATLAVGADGVVSRIDGLLLLTAITVYTTLLIRRGSAQVPADISAADRESADVPSAGPAPLPRSVFYVMLGLGALILGSRWLVDASVALAQRVGVSELVVGLTIVAAGTSLPEVATSIIATIRGERDIAVGNVVGSNIFNVLAVLGMAGAVSTDGVAVSAAALRTDIPVMVGVSLLALPVFLTGRLISRWEGALFLVLYAIYTVYIVWDATGSPAASIIRSNFWWIIALLLIPLLVSMLRSVQAGVSAPSRVLRDYGPRTLRATYNAELQRHVVGSLSAPTLREEDIAHLPEIVKRYIRQSGAVGAPVVRNVRARFRGRIRSGPNTEWMRFTGEQHNTYNPVTRLFFMDARMRGLPAQVLHRYIGESATMDVRLAGLIPIARAAGPEMNVAETVTLLNDMFWIAPGALAFASIQWEDVNPTTVRATYQNAGHLVRADLSFSDDGDLINFVSDDRAIAAPDGRSFTPARWSTPFRNYRTFGKLRLSSAGEGIWHTNSGSYTYIELELLDLAVNVAPPVG